MKGWFGRNWWLVVGVVIIGFIFAILVHSGMEKLSEARACDECIQANCAEIDDACTCAECIILCR